MISNVMIIWCRFIQQTVSKSLYFVVGASCLCSVLPTVTYIVFMFLCMKCDS